MRDRIPSLSTSIPASTVHPPSSRLLVNFLGCCRMRIGWGKEMGRISDRPRPQYWFPFFAVQIQIARHSRTCNLVAETTHKQDLGPGCFVNRDRRASTYYAGSAIEYTQLGLGALILPFRGFAWLGSRGVGANSVLTYRRTRCSVSHRLHYPGYTSGGDPLQLRPEVTSEQLAVSLCALSGRSLPRFAVGVLSASHRVT